MATAIRLDREDLRGYRRGHRYYTWRDENYWSVTTLIDKGLPIPALPRWAAKLTAETAVNQIETLNALVDSDGPEGAVDWLKGAPWRSSTKAADSGTSIHEFAEALFAGNAEAAALLYEDLSPEDQAKARQVEGFVRTVDMDVLEVEAVLFNRSAWFAGTVDLIARINDPKIVEPMGLEAPATLVIDLKTGKGVYDSFALQIAAYSRAEFIARMDGTESPMPDIDGGAVLHVTDDSWAVIPVDTSRSTFEAFLTVAATARWLDGDGKKAVGKAVVRGRA